MPINQADGIIVCKMQSSARLVRTDIFRLREKRHVRASRFIPNGIDFYGWHCPHYWRKAHTAKDVFAPAFVFPRAKRSGVPSTQNPFKVPLAFQ